MKKLKTKPVAKKPASPANTVHTLWQPRSDEDYAEDEDYEYDIDEGRYVKKKKPDDDTIYIIDEDYPRKNK